MTYEEAKLQIETYQETVLGMPLGETIVEYMIISTREKLSEVVSQILGEDGNNYIALIQEGIVDNEDLEVFLFQKRHVQGEFTTLDSFLSKL